jgi:hypothetical protein
MRAIVAAAAEDGFPAGRIDPINQQSFTKTECARREYEHHDRGISRKG